MPRKSRSDARRRKILKRPPECVQKLQEEFMSRINRSRTTPVHNVTVADFVEHTFFPHIEGRRNLSTVHTHRLYWNKQLRPRCGGTLLRDFSTPDVQLLLDHIARVNPEMKRATLYRLKSLLSAILRLAVNQGFHMGPNPVREVEVPDAPDGEETVAYNLNTVIRMLQILPEPARTAVGVAAFGGLRRGEIEGLTWEAYRGDQLRVLRAMWRSHVGQPKTRNSKAPIPVIAPLRRMLDEQRARCGNPEMGVMFKTRNNTPLSLNNLLYDQILPALEQCQHCGKGRTEHAAAEHTYSRDHSRPKWHGWHAFRRGLATILHDLGVDDKTIQAIMRHSSVAVTQQAYIKTLPKQSVDAMKRLEMLIGDTSSAILQ
jgi:integrase